MAPLILIWSLLSSAIFVNSEIRITLNSGDFSGVWAVRNDSSSDKIEAHVPGGIYSDLNLAQDLFYRLNDRAFRWVGYENWTYETTFELSEEILNKTAINLVFHGIDTIGDVFLNGQLVQSVNNMFVRYVIPIKEIAKEQNSLEVRLKSPVQAALEAVENSDIDVIPSCTPQPDQPGECYVFMLRKMQASFSWDWGPAAPSVGIWKSVEIEAFNTAIVRSVVGPVRSENDTWVVEGVCYYEGATEDDSSWGSWEYGIGITAPNLTRVAHAKEVRRNFISTNAFTYNYTFVLGKASTVTWWPNGYGDQPLYQLECEFKTLNEFDNEESVKSQNVGLRSVEVIQEEIQPGKEGLSFYFKVNDVPIFAKGSNWIPGHILPELGSEERMLRRTLQSVKDAHMNMLRVWGGGVYESDLFYDICDELGIMIWQDMMFADALYPGNEPYLQSVAAEIDQNVKRLINHPSVAIWSGNNECEAVMGFATKNRFIEVNSSNPYVDNYLRLYAEIIKPIVETNDNSRLYVLSSPSNGPETIEEGGIAEDPNSPLWGDVHYYNYNNDPRNISLYMNTRFASEYGFQGMASFKSISQISLPGDWNLSSEFSVSRQHHPFGYYEMTNLMKYFLPLPEDDGSEEFYKTFIYYSQISQAISTKTESEKYRVDRNKLTDDNQGHTMGALYWQLNDVWQAPTWSSIEFGGRWKMLHYYAVKFFAPLAVIPQLTDSGELEIYVVSDLLEEVVCNVTVSLYSWDDFQSISTITLIEEEVQNSTSYKSFSLDLTDYLQSFGCSETSCFFYLTLTGEDIFAENFFYPSSFTDIKNLEPAELSVNVTREDNSNDILIHLTTDRIAPFLWLETDVEGILSDNGFTLIKDTTQLKFSNRGEEIDVEKFKETLVVRSLLS